MSIKANARWNSARVVAAVCVAASRRGLGAGLSAAGTPGDRERIEEVFKVLHFLRWQALRQEGLRSTLGRMN